MTSKAKYYRRASYALLLAASAQTNAAEIACEYNENSEWPSVEAMVCQDRTPPAIAPLLLSDDMSQYSQWPICFSKESDPDEDGWGWENYRSCIVNTVIHAFPECALPGSDLDGDGWGWENEGSCRAGITSTDNTTEEESETNIEYETAGEETEEESTPEPAAALEADPAVIYTQHFNDSIRGHYTPEQLNTEWHTPLWHLGLNEQRVSIVSDSHDSDAWEGGALSVKLPANEYGFNGASAFLSELKFDDDSNSNYEELYLSYDVKFSENFEFVKGGKLPGLCGYSVSKDAGQGCNTGGGFPDGYDGWSARSMWREDGALENYVYHAGQKNYYGDSEHWNVKAVPGKWHSIQHRVVLNTVGQANGKLEAWFDGVKVLSKENFEFRKTEDIRINLFYFSNFFGGADPSWAPSTDQYLFFDNVRISTQSHPDLKTTANLLQDDAEGTTVAPKSGGGAFFMLPLLMLLWPRRGS